MDMRNKVFKKSIIILIIFTIGVFTYSINNKIMAISSDTTLKSIDISPKNEKLTQDETNKNIYRTVVSNDVTSVDVDVIPNDSNATIEISGNKELQEGTNKVIVKVTAESGESEEYIIYVRRTSKPISEQNVVPNVQGKSEEEQSSGGSEYSENYVNVKEKIENENKEQLNNSNINTNTTIYIVLAIVIILILIIVIITIIKIKNKKS